MGKKKVLSDADHQELAPKVKQTHALLCDVLIRTTSAFGAKSKAVKAAGKVLAKIDDKLVPELKRLADEQGAANLEMYRVVREPSEPVTENIRRLGYGEHLEIGLRIKEARKLLHELSLTIGNTQGHSSNAARIIWTATDRDFENLRNELDNLVFRDCPERGDELKSVYYGPTTRDRVVMLKNPKS